MTDLTASARRDRKSMAERVAQDIPTGWYVNLGIGIPTLVSDYLAAEREVILHSENGILGMGPAPAPGTESRWLVNAGKQYVTLRPGGAFFHHADSFAMVRGGHLDLCVLGAFEVAANGDLANWSTAATDAAPAVGGAMDLAVGAKNVWVVMDHVTKTGGHRLVEGCRYPLTASAVVKRIYTDLAVLEPNGTGFDVLEIVDGVQLEALQAETGARLHDCRDGSR